MMSLMWSPKAPQLPSRRSGASPGIGTIPRRAERRRRQISMAMLNSMRPSINRRPPIESDTIALPERRPTTMRPTQALQVLRYRRTKLTTKDVGKGFYKGNRTGAMGRHTKYGGYVVEWEKVRTYVAPLALKDFKVRPTPAPVASVLTSPRAAHALCDPRDQAAHWQLQGPAEGRQRPSLLRRPVEATQRRRLNHGNLHRDRRYG
jgi:hypothetical protein